MDTDESPSERAASRAALSNISSLSNAIMHISDPEDSSSDFRWRVHRIKIKIEPSQSYGVFKVYLEL